MPGMILRRIEPGRYSEVLPAWRGETVVILAGGPSLTLTQVAQVREAHEDRKVRCIAVNNAYLVAPWADVSYAADWSWHEWHTNGTPAHYLRLSAAHVRHQWATFAGQKCSIENYGGRPPGEHVHLLRNAHGNRHGFGLSRDPGALVTGRNSGFQALNLAVLAGAKKIVLLGFDGQPAPDGWTHWFGEHPRPTPASAYPYYRQAMSAAENDILAAGVEVVNCSPGSAIDSFPKLRLEDVI